MLRSRSVHLLIILILLSGASLPAQQQDIRFDQLTIEDGLSQSSVFTILQDSRGFIWFGTEDGLNKYDGYTFRIYSTSKNLDSTSLSDSWINWLVEDRDSVIWIACSEGGLNRFDPITQTFDHFFNRPGDPASLSSNRIQTLYIDDKNNLWVGTAGDGLNRFNRKGRSFTRYMHSDENPQSLSDNKILSIFEDHTGRLWIGTDGGGLNAFDPETEHFSVYNYGSRNSTSLSNGRIYAIAEDSSGVLWLATDAGLNTLDKTRKEFRTYLYDEKSVYSPGSNQIRSLCIDHQQHLWIGTYGGGLNLYDRRNDRFIRYRNDKTDPKSLSNNMVWSILADRSGLIWIGTNNGINKFGKEKFRLYKNNPADTFSLANNFLWSICEDAQSGIWIGTNGGGLDLLNPATGSFTHHRNNPDDPNSLPGDRVLAVTANPEGTLWIGTHSNGLSLYDPARNRFTNWRNDPEDPGSLPNNNVWCILRDSRAELWVGTDGGLCRYDYGDNRFDTGGFLGRTKNERIRSIYEDRDGSVWIGTYGTGAYRYDPTDGNLVNFRAHPDSSENLSDNRVSSFLRDSRGRMWIGTAKGLNLFDPTTRSFRVYLEHEGLPNNVIYAILEDKYGNLWISTNKGLSCFDPENGSFRNFNVNDGLQSNEFNSGAYCLSNTGLMYFGGVNGFNVFDPDRLKPSGYLAPVYLTGFRIFDHEARFGKSLADLKEIELSYRQNYFSFEFASLDFANPQKNRYEYKLDGFDAQWISSGSRRFASYTNIDGGSYTFMIRGSNSDGVWNPKITEMGITITPPFWQTWWFRITAAFILLLTLVTIYRYRMNRIKRQKEKLEQLVQEQTEELRESYKETDDIMDNVAEGLFLLNDELMFGRRYSKALEKILNTPVIANQNFIEFLTNKIPESEVQAVTEYLDLLLSGEHDTDMLSELNPLRDIRFSFLSEDMHIPEEKYLDFNFRPLEEIRKKSRQLMVTVNDVSPRIRLSQQLAAAEAKTKKQMELLLSLLHVDPQMLREFMESFDRELNCIQKLLRDPGQNADLPGILEKVFRSMHMIKGNASLLELNLFAKMAHEFEDEIALLREREKLSGNDFVSLVLKLGDIKNTFDDVNHLFERLSRVHQHLRPKRSYENKLLITSFNNLINQLKKELNKKVRLVTKGFNPENIPFRYRLVVKDILIQLIRNAVAHGIEPWEIRKESGKPPVGTIELKSHANKGYFEFSIRDDGWGIQIDRLRKVAENTGKWKIREIKKWSDDRVAELIFMSGISTSENVKLSAGRGVGMDLVRQKINQYKGSINIAFEKNSHTTFHIKLPVEK